MTKKKTPKPPAKRPVGRPKAEPTMPISMRFKARQYEYLMEIGGTRAVRSWLIDKAAKEGRDIG